MTLKYIVEPDDGNSYFKIDQNTGELRVRDRNGLLSSSVSTYEVKLFLEDSNVVAPSNPTYIVYFDIKNSNNRGKEKSKHNS